MKKILLSIALCGLIVLSMSQGALACPGCAASLNSMAGTSQEVIWGKAFCMSIYFMLFAVHSLIAFVIYKGYKLINAEEKRYEAKDKVQA